MKKIIITQRLELFGRYNELRDSMDIRLTKFMQGIGFLPISIPNYIKDINLFIKEIKPSGIILSGGGSSYKNDERAKLEKKLIKFSIKKNIPILGICRGAQSINKYFGGKQKRIKNHVRKKHTVFFVNKNLNSIQTNSFHDYGFNKIQISKNLRILGVSKDNNVEYFAHKKYNIFGIMWHPERYNNIKKIDKKILYDIFKK